MVGGSSSTVPALSSRTTNPDGSQGVANIGLLDKDGALVGNPGHYRDPRWPAAVERAHRRVPPVARYRLTGCQTLPSNILYQLVALDELPLLEAP